MDRFPSAPGSPPHRPTDRAADPGPAAPGPGPAESPLDRVLLPRILGVPVLTVALLTFATAVVLGNYLPTMAEGAATSRSLETREAENSALARRIRALEAEAEALEKDPWLNERILRDELRMTRQGEVPVR